MQLYLLVSIGLLVTRFGIHISRTHCLYFYFLATVVVSVYEYEKSLRAVGIVNYPVRLRTV